MQAERLGCLKPFRAAEGQERSCEAPDAAPRVMHVIRSSRVGEMGDLDCPQAAGKQNGGSVTVRWCALFILRGRGIAYVGL